MKKMMMLNDVEQRVVRKMRKNVHDAGYDVRYDWRQITLMDNFAVRKDSKPASGDKVAHLVNMYSVTGTLTEKGVPDYVDQNLDVQLVHLMEDRAKAIRLAMPEVFRAEATEPSDEQVFADFYGAPKAAT